jgi:hypothetical protein
MFCKLTAGMFVTLPVFVCCRGNTASVLRIVPYAAIHFGERRNHTFAKSIYSAAATASSTSAFA